MTPTQKHPVVALSGGKDESPAMTAPAPLRVLVCGGRAFRDQLLANETLDFLNLDHPIGCIIQGGSFGADFIAKLWAYSQAVPVEEFPADWRAHGKAAGPIRNKRMIQEGRPDLVLAFPGGSGTQNCIRQARAAGIQVVEVKK